MSTSFLGVRCNLYLYIELHLTPNELDIYSISLTSSHEKPYTIMQGKTMYGSILVFI